MRGGMPGGLLDSSGQNSCEAHPALQVNNRELPTRAVAVSQHCVALAN